MPDKLLEFLITHFDFMRTSGIHKANYLASNRKD